MPAEGLAIFGESVEPFAFANDGSMEDFRRWWVREARTLGLAVAEGGARFVGEGGPGPRRERPLLPAEGAGDMPAFGGLVARGDPGGTTDGRAEDTRAKLGRAESEERCQDSQTRTQDMSDATHTIIPSC